MYISRQGISLSGLSECMQRITYMTRTSPIFLQVILRYLSLGCGSLQVEAWRIDNPWVARGRTRSYLSWSADRNFAQIPFFSCGWLIWEDHRSCTLMRQQALHVSYCLCSQVVDRAVTNCTSMLLSRIASFLLKRLTLHPTSIDCSPLSVKCIECVSHFEANQ